MHGCVISTMFGWCFWFFKKTFLSKQLSIPTLQVLHISHSDSLTRRSSPSPRSFAFLTPVLYLIDPPRPILRIFHSDSLTHRSRQVVVSSGWRYILQNYNYKLHFQNLSIYHIARFFLDGQKMDDGTNIGFHHWATVGQSGRLQGRVLSVKTLARCKRERRRRRSSRSHFWWQHMEGPTPFSVATVRPA